MQKFLSQNEQTNIDSLMLQVEHSSAGPVRLDSSVSGEDVDFLGLLSVLIAVGAGQKYQHSG